MPSTFAEWIAFILSALMTGKVTIPIPIHISDPKGPSGAAGPVYDPAGGILVKYDPETKHLDVTPATTER